MRHRIVDIQSAMFDQGHSDREITTSGGADDLACSSSTGEGSPEKRVAWWRDLLGWHAGNKACSASKVAPADTQLPVIHTASEHLKWARNVRKAQGKWLQEHKYERRHEKQASLIAPNPSANWGPSERHAVSSFSDWAQTLREHSDIGLVPQAWQDKKYEHRITKTRLRSLQASQFKWLRNSQEASRRNQGSCNAPMRLFVIRGQSSESEDGLTENTQELSIEGIGGKEEPVNRNLSSIGSQSTRGTSSRTPSKDTSSLSFSDSPASHRGDRADRHETCFGLPDIQQDKSATISNSSTYRDWEEWRIKFSRRRLDALTHFYHLQLQDHSKPHLGILKKRARAAVVEIFGLPLDAVEMIRDCEIEDTGDNTSTLEMASGSHGLLRFLSLVEAIFKQVCKLHPELMWEKDDLQNVLALFRQHASLTDAVSMTNLIDIMKELKILPKNARIKGSNGWLVGLVQDIAHSRSRTTKQHSAEFSLLDVLRVVPQVARALERHRRHQALIRETEARLATGFTLAEVEDLRELHSTLLVQLKSECHQTTLACMVSLMNTCGVKDLSRSDVFNLQRILQKTLSEDHASSVQAHIPFDAFLNIMHQVFIHRIGGLGRHDGVSSMHKESDGTCCQGRFIDAMMKCCKGGPTLLADSAPDEFADK